MLPIYQAVNDSFSSQGPGGNRGADAVKGLFDWWVGARRFVLKLSSDGYIWEIPAGPMTIRYTAVIKDGVWHEVGDRIAPGKEPVRFFDMSQRRIGDTNWPAAGAVSPTDK